MVVDEKLSREENWTRLAVLSQAGDPDAYRKLLKELRTYLLSIGEKKSLSPEQRDDLVQDVLVSVHKALHTYDVSRPFLPWFHAILHFRMNDKFREIYKSKKFEELDPNAHPYVTFEEDLANKELTDSLAEALERLPDRQRAIVVSLKLDGLSVKETALRLGMSEPSIKVNAHRAYKLMKRWLSKEKF